MELPAKANAETIHEATAPLASLLELKSLSDPVGVNHSHALVLQDGSPLPRLHPVMLQQSN